MLKEIKYTWYKKRKKMFGFYQGLCYGRNEQNIKYIFFWCAYHNLRCDIESNSWRGILDTTLCDKVYQWHYQVDGYLNQ
jgi:hypothetical protein